MDSASLAEYGFREWRKLSDLKTDMASIPDQPGTYVLRLNSRLERLRGKSDILYIGCTEKSIRKRIRRHLKGMGKKTAWRIHQNLMDRGYLDHVEASWVISSREEARELEKRLLKGYEKDHEELPPWNRSM